MGSGKRDHGFAIVHSCALVAMPVQSRSAPPDSTVGKVSQASPKASPSGCTGRVLIDVAVVVGRAPVGVIVVVTRVAILRRNGSSRSGLRCGAVDAGVPTGMVGVEWEGVGRTALVAGRSRFRLRLSRPGSGCLRSGIVAGVRNRRAGVCSAWLPERRRAVSPEWRNRRRRYRGCMRRHSVGRDVYRSAGIRGRIKCRRRRPTGRVGSAGPFPRDRSCPSRGRVRSEVTGRVVGMPSCS